MREVARAAGGSIFRKGCNIVVVAKAPIGSLTFSAAKEKLLDAFTRVH